MKNKWIRRLALGMSGIMMLGMLGGCGAPKDQKQETSGGG